MNLPAEESMRIHPYAKTVLNTIESNADNSKNVIGLSFLGSFARGDASYYSDIDLVAVVSDHHDEDDALNELTRGMDFTMLTRKDSKAVLYNFNEGQKLELTIVKERELGKVEKLFRGSRINSLETAIIIDKNGSLKAKFSDWQMPLGLKPSGSEVNEEARSFLYYYESMNVPLSRGDTYRAYFIYSLMYFKLAALMSVYLGNGDFLYNPPFLINSLRDFDSQLVIRFKKLLPTLEPSNLNEKREEAFDLFTEISTKMPSMGRDISAMASSMRKFVNDRYPSLWKLRDLCYRDSIRAGRIYRSARLTVYNADILKKWISRLGLKTIVDLRGEEEAKLDPYDSRGLISVRYVQSPVILGGKDSQTTEIPDDQISEEPKVVAYETATDNDSVKRALRTVMNLLSDRDNLPLLFHCTSGSDRTGIIAATIEGLAGVPNEVILNNYLASSTLLKSRYITAYLRKVEEIGGFAVFVANTGVSPQVIESAKKNISQVKMVEGERRSKV